jgi:hypothetical protein
VVRIDGESSGPRWLQKSKFSDKMSLEFQAQFVLIRAKQIFALHFEIFFYDLLSLQNSQDVFVVVNPASQLFSATHPAVSLHCASAHLDYRLVPWPEYRVD